MGPLASSPSLSQQDFLCCLSLGIAEKQFVSSTNTNHERIPSKIESTASLDLNTYLLGIKTMGLGFIKGVVFNLSSRLLAQP